MRHIIAPLFAASLAGVALADPACTHAPLITDIATQIIDGRGALPSLAQPRFGDNAAFMMIRYGGAEGSAVLNEILASGARLPRLFDDLEQAYLLSQPGGLDVWQTAGPLTLDEFSMMMPSTRRALALADEGDTYMRLLTAVMADETLANRVTQADMFGLQLAFAIGDQPDSIRATLAEKAERAGHLWVAAALLGDMEDRSAFYAFEERNAGAAIFSTMSASDMMTMSTIGALSGDTPLRGPRPDDASLTLLEAQTFTVFKAAMAGQPADYMGTYLNQSGQAQAAAFAAQTLLNAVAAGEIDPVADPEAAWILMYDTLVAQVGEGAVRNALSGFSWPAQSIRSYGGSAVDSLDLMKTTRLLAPYVAGTDADAPAAPAIYADATWAMVLKVATAARARDLAGLSAEETRLGVEMLWAAGAYDEAVTAAAALPDLTMRLEFMRDAMGRLDAQCGAYVGTRGAALRFGGSAIYRFD